jgi:hypothetical protein
MTKPIVHETQEVAALRGQVAELRKDNDQLRSFIAKSPLPCPYCGLAAEDMSRCASGFPGCGRADDLLASEEEPAPTVRTLESWKKRYYPIAAKDCPEEDALEHSIQKWEGLRQGVLQEYGLHRDASGLSLTVADSLGNKLAINDQTCALCYHYTENNEEIDCLRCPLRAEKVRRRQDPDAFADDTLSCDREYSIWAAISNPIPMIELLRAAAEWDGEASA